MAERLIDWKKHNSLPWLENNTVLLVKHGSHAYGLNISTSDLDIKGICIPPIEYFLGWLKKFEQAESKEPDSVIYDIRKFFQLACDCNPNIIEVLFVEPEDILKNSVVGEFLIHFRTLFLSQKAKHTFSGYAISQLRRIKSHKKWLLNPLGHKPTRQEYNLPESTVLANDQLGAIKSVIGDDWTLEDRFVPITDPKCAEFDANVMKVYQQERSYHNALMHWTQYQNWKKNRNPARSELEAKFGYDTKHAMHLVRLMRMCREIITEGKVVVKRPDREELLAIRSGAWEYDKLVEWAETQDIENGELLKTSPLRHSPDKDYLNGLCKAWVEYFHYGFK